MSSRYSLPVCELVPSGVNYMSPICFCHACIQWKMKDPCVDLKRYRCKDDTCKTHEEHIAKNSQDCRCCHK